MENSAEELFGAKKDGDVGGAGQRAVIDKDGERG